MGKTFCEARIYNNNYKLVLIFIYVQSGINCVPFFSYDADPTNRMTFWALTVGGVFFFFAIYAANQPCMQRTCALSTLTKARWWLSRIILWKHTIEQIYWWQISTILVYSFHKNLDNCWCFFQVNDPHWSIIWNSCLVVSGSWYGSIRLLPTKRMWPNTGKLSDQLKPGICIISCNIWKNKKYTWSMSTLSHERSTTFLADYTLFRNRSFMLSWSSRHLFCVSLQWISKVWHVIFFPSFKRVHSHTDTSHRFLLSSTIAPCHHL